MDDVPGLYMWGVVGCRPTTAQIRANLFSRSKGVNRVWSLDAKSSVGVAKCVRAHAANGRNVRPARAGLGVPWRPAGACQARGVTTTLSRKPNDRARHFANFSGVSSYRRHARHIHVGSGWLPAHGADSRVSVSSRLSSDGCRILAARTRVRRGTRNGMGLRRRSAGGGAL